MVRKLSVTHYQSVLCTAIASVALTLVSSGEPHASDLSPAHLSVWKELYKRPPPNAINKAVTRDNKRDSKAVIALGKRLFFDSRFSADNRRSCASCHNPERGFTEGIPTAAGPDGQPGPLNTPTLWNLATAAALNWDGKVKTLEAQIPLPVEGPGEFANTMAVVLKRLNSDRALLREIRKAFPDATLIKRIHVVWALAAYERSLVSPRTRFDAWVEGQPGALTGQERAGFALFVGKGGCARCHSGWRFTDDRVHDIGLPMSSTTVIATRNAGPERTAFKTPTLRELQSTAPYMHNGSIATLDAAVRHYTSGIEERPSLSPNLEVDLTLTDEEIKSLVAFLRTLSGG